MFGTASHEVRVDDDFRGAIPAREVAEGGHVHDRQGPLLASYENASMTAGESAILVVTLDRRPSDRDTQLWPLIVVLPNSTDLRDAVRVEDGRVLEFG